MFDDIYGVARIGAEYACVDAVRGDQPSPGGQVRYKT
jgi:hypothetical protein